MSESSQEVLTRLFGELMKLDEESLREVNRFACDRIEAMASMKAFAVRSRLRIGSEVWWESKKKRHQGLKYKGKIVEFKKTRAQIITESGMVWIVPYQMLHEVGA